MGGPPVRWPQEEPMNGGSLGERGWRAGRAAGADERTSACAMRARSPRQAAGRVIQRCRSIAMALSGFSRGSLKL